MGDAAAHRAVPLDPDDLSRARLYEGTSSGVTARRGRAGRPECETALPGRAARASIRAMLRQLIIGRGVSAPR
ncbi:hypothetical protein [Streptomyces sp. SHP 1-2]|uniref:hypothetical protein n=1 Tax=Streptomyces sp. SHP 1-2 TaxID=2769489 RepID=UPI0022387780|nr:hypothetical protein [Streptomyces sp. SHP 1-2]MCW5250373.1 hypothetical protein [Streptomyces sp. SHP 1-2]